MKSYIGAVEDLLLAAEFEWNKEKITNGNYSTMSYWSGRIDAFKEATEEIVLIREQILCIEAAFNCAQQRLIKIGIIANTPLLQEWE
jgi:hypothetical protein